jgi:DNA polymerase-3 subunit beta
MHFAVQKDILVKALRDVTNAVSTRAVQPILSNVLIETEDDSAIVLRATDLDLAIQTKVSGVVHTKGSVTLPAKKLLEIISKLPNELVVFQVNKETLETLITCHRSKFNIVGLPSDDFPKFIEAKSANGVFIPVEVLHRSVLQTGFAAASYDSSSILGGVYMVVDQGAFECTATDGSRLAHRRELLNVSVAAKRKVEDDKETESKSSTATLEKNVSLRATIPARACNELVKLIDGKAETNTARTEVRMAVISGQIVFETNGHLISSRLIAGEYPRYQELFPTEYKYLCNFEREEMVAAVERVSVMSDDRTHLIKMHFEGQTLQISANTPDVGKAVEEVPVRFEGQVIDIAVNVRYLLDVLQRLQSKEMQLEMTGPLKPLIIKGAGDENYKYLLMPVQAK